MSTSISHRVVIVPLLVFAGFSFTGRFQSLVPITVYLVVLIDGIDPLVVRLIDSECTAVCTKGNNFITIKRLYDPLPYSFRIDVFR